MKLSEMIRNLHEILDKHGDIDCYYAIDDEGNDYRPVRYKPSFYYINEESKEAHTAEYLDFMEENIDDYTPICVIN